MQRPSFAERDRRSRVHKGSAVVIDQSVSSATNLIVLLAAASLLDAADFGAFALSSSIVGIALGVTRTTSAERIAVDQSVAPTARVPIAPTSALTILGVTIAAVALLALVTDREVAAVWLVGAPLLLTQDRLRFVAFRERPGLALASDLTWSLVVVVVWALVPGDIIGQLEALVLLVAGGPAVGLLVIAVPLRHEIAWRAAHDLRQTLTELVFVADAWLLSVAVLIALAIVGLVDSLELTGQARLLLLLFQPFFWIAYAGRWFVLRASRHTTLRYWHRWLAFSCAGYGVLTGGMLLLAGEQWNLPPLWDFDATAFVVTAMSQIARASHQGLADVARRRGIGEIAVSRLVFAVVLVSLAAPFGNAWRLDGVAACYLLAFTAGAFDIHRRMNAHSEGMVDSDE